MNTPHLYQVSDLVKDTQEKATLHSERGWIPVRPLGFEGLSLRRRLKLAWGVFTGRFDAVDWVPTLRQVGKALAEEKYPDAEAPRHDPASVIQPLTGVHLVWDVYNKWGRLGPTVVSPLNWDAHSVYQNLVAQRYSPDISVQLRSGPVANSDTDDAASAALLAASSSYNQ
jgi:hypothetical protein